MLAALAAPSERSASDRCGWLPFPSLVHHRNAKQYPARAGDDKVQKGGGPLRWKEGGTLNQSNPKLSTTVKPSSRAKRFQQGSSLYLNASTPNSIYPTLMLRRLTTAA
jgi:hypothetical protein